MSLAPRCRSPLDLNDKPQIRTVGLVLSTRRRLAARQRTRRPAHRCIIQSRPPARLLATPGVSTIRPPDPPAHEFAGHPLYCSLRWRLFSHRVGLHFAIAEGREHVQHRAPHGRHLAAGGGPGTLACSGCRSRKVLSRAHARTRLPASAGLLVGRRRCHYRPGRGLEVALRFRAVAPSLQALRLKLSSALRRSSVPPGPRCVSCYPPRRGSDVILSLAA